ncbi:MAG TPA: sulfatase [Planctomycetaceae bacterium]|nr:sulfatase [Planctomycetaceae bacterium]
MSPLNELLARSTRRHFFGRTAAATGVAALASLLRPERLAAATQSPVVIGGLPGLPHFAPKAKRVIYLFQSGGPSQLELFDDKPLVREKHGSELPDSIRMGQRLTGMTSGQKSFPVVGSQFKFTAHGECGMQLSELLPHTAKVADHLCLVRSLHTEAINHDPAITFMQTGSQQPGRPSLGSWAAYGLGTFAEELPAFLVMISHGSGKDSNQGLLDRLWGSGFLPSNHQGVKLRVAGDPVLYLTDPPGIDRDLRRTMLDGLAKLNEQQLEQTGDPEIATRIAQFEMAFRMQSSVPELTELSNESQATFDLYGPESRKPGTFAANCLLARRLIERGVRFVQLYHRGWDQHGGLPSNIPLQCKDIDQPQAALVRDLQQRGLLDETLIVWGGEFGRTVYGQGGLQDNYGRDHHGRCFSMWLAGGGIKPGLTYGATDDFSYNITENPVHVHDLNATLLHCLGINHERLTFRSQGRDYRLTDVEGTVVKDILA